MTKTTANKPVTFSRKRSIEAAKATADFIGSLTKTAEEFREVISLLATAHDIALLSAKPTIDRINQN